MLTAQQTHIHGLVNLAEADSSFRIELKYATEDNFTGEILYASFEAFLLKPVADRLVRVQEKLKPFDLYIKIWDAYRPHSVQYKMWEKVADPRYVADPKKGSNHNRGCAVDVTLVDSTGIELLMPTGFDDFTRKAHSDYNKLPDTILTNRNLLKNMMESEDFIQLSTEWWHFSVPDCDQFPVLNIQPQNISNNE